MQKRDNKLTVSLSKLSRTDRECHSCENGYFLRDGHELVCESCFYAPDNTERRDEKGEWQEHREQVERSRESEGRVFLVGGYPDAYWGGDGDYEYNPGSGFSFK